MSGERIGRGYDRLASSYDLLARAVYGNALRSAQSCFLDTLPKSAAILVLGGGSGWFLEALLRVAQPHKVVYVELSAAMLQHAQARIRDKFPEALDRVQFVQGRAEDAAQWGRFDVVITHCLLDMYPQPALLSLIAKLRGCLQADGIWYFSDFFVVKRGWMRPISCAMVWLMYRFFRLFCGIAATELPDFDAAFATCGLAKVNTRTFFGGMIKAKLYRIDHVALIP
jgi:tRNA (cmo5U34)-methyltransferase